MTHRRAPNSVEALLLEAAHDLSDRDCERLGYSRAYILACTNPMRREQAPYKLIHSIVALRSERGEPPLFIDHLQQAAKSRPLDALQQLGRSIAQVNAEMGDLNRAYADASEDDDYSTEEIRRLAQESDDVATKAGNLRDSLLARLRPVSIQRKGSPS